MPKIVREDVDNLNTVLTVTIEKSDYRPKFDSELDKYRKQAHMRGFRKGKTPKSVLRKMYGKAVLSEIINNILQEEVSRFLTDEELNFLGQPLPNADQEVYDFDPRMLEDFEFKFDLGLAPDIELQLPEQAFPIYDVEITDELVEEELDKARKRFGERVAVEDEIRSGDLVKFKFRELEGEQVKEEGIESEFSVLVDRMMDEVREQVEQLKTGDTLRVNIYELEKDTTPDYVHKHFLQLVQEDEAEKIDRADMNEWYEATIEEVTRIQDAELDQAFFDQYFGEGEVSSEEEARQTIRESMEQYYDRQAEAVMFRELQQYLLDNHPVSLPDDFLKRWLKFNNQEVTEGEIEDQYDDFAENMQWTLIRSQLVKKYDIQVMEGEIKAVFKQQIAGMISNPAMFDDAFLNNMAERMMERKEDYNRVAEQILSDKVFAELKKELDLEARPISVEDFKQVIDDIKTENETRAAKAAARAAAEEEE